MWQRTKVTDFTGAIDEMLRADLSAPRKQRHKAGRPVAEVFIAQTHQPGAEDEVDFAELWVDLPTGRTAPGSATGNRSA